jgi:hypothetical protein
MSLVSVLKDVKTAAHVANTVICRVPTVLKCTAVLPLRTYQYSDVSQCDSMHKAQMFHLQGRRELHALGHIEDDRVGLHYMFEFF